MRGERVDGKYELRRLLGKGTMGAVFECVHVDGGKRVAVKLIHPVHAAKADAAPRFRHQAKAFRAVESDYVAKLLDFGRDERHGLFMVLEYLEGEDLAARLSRERWIAEVPAATIAVQMGRGLERAHAAGIVHGDLKPENVFLTRDSDGSWHVKLLDFGISLRDSNEGAGGPDPSADDTIPMQGMRDVPLGTLQYWAPEQIQGHPVDAETDVWAMAAILYEMLAGEPAVIEPGGASALAQRIVKDDVPRLATRASWVDPRLAAVVDAGLVRERDVRVRDAATWVARLLEVIPEAGARPAPPSGLAVSTDVSELGPPDSDVSVGATTERNLRSALPLPSPPEIARPDTEVPPSGGDPAPSAEDTVAVFERGPREPRELTPTSGVRDKSKSR